MADYDITSGAEFTINATSNNYYYTAQIDTNHAIVVFWWPDDDGFAQVVTRDPTDNSLSAEGSPLEFETTHFNFSSVVQVDDNHFLVVYRRDGASTTRMVILEVNLTTYAVTQPWTNYELSNAEESRITVDLLDSYKCVAGWQTIWWDIKAQVISVNNTTWELTTWTLFTVDTSTSSGGNSIEIIDSTHFIMSWTWPSFDGFVRIMSVSGTTISFAWSELEHDTSRQASCSIVLIDSTHFGIMYEWDRSDGFIKTFSFDGSYDITQINSLEFDTDNGRQVHEKWLAKIDDAHLIWAYWTFSNVEVSTFEINGSYVITEKDSTTYGDSWSLQVPVCELDTGRFLIVYADSGALKSRVLIIEWVDPVWATFLPKIAWF